MLTYVGTTVDLTEMVTSEQRLESGREQVMRLFGEGEFQESEQTVQSVKWSMPGVFEELWKSVGWSGVNKKKSSVK